MALLVCNAQGYRIGESHANCRISDATVDAIREAHEEDGMSYKRLAARYGLAPSTVQKICNYSRRAQTPERWVRTGLKEEDDDGV